MTGDRNRAPDTSSRYVAPTRTNPGGGAAGAGADRSLSVPLPVTPPFGMDTWTPEGSVSVAADPGPTRISPVGTVGGVLGVAGVDDPADVRGAVRRAGGLLVQLVATRSSTQMAAARRR